MTRPFKLTQGLQGLLATCIVLAATWGPAQAAETGRQDKAVDKAGPKAAATAPSPSLTRMAFDRVDLNHDGVISLDEFHKDIVRSWHALDMDGDGHVTRDEWRSIPSRQVAQWWQSTLKQHDEDGDQRLSFKELVKARMAYFDAADLNSDEKLRLSEVLQHEHARAGRR